MPQITPELCQHSRLVFYPKTVEEAILIQRKLFDLGCAWGSVGANVNNAKGCVSVGLAVVCGTLSTDPVPNSANIPCTLADFGTLSTDPMLNSANISCTLADFENPVPQKTLNDIFSLLSEMRKEIFALKKEVLEIREEVLPQKIGKFPKLPGAGK